MDDVMDDEAEAEQSTVGNDVVVPEEMMEVYDGTIEAPQVV
jgi:hypothetical protein